MACFRPVPAWQRLDGGPVSFHEVSDSRPLLLPCGHCVGCYLARSKAWAVRCVHESQLHECNEFVTLTYDEASVPPDGSLRYADFQAFIRALRLEFGIFDVTLWQWLPRYFVAGEYGEQNARPHFHALLFGVRFADRVYDRNSPAGSALYRSATLSRLWSRGFASTGDVTFESAAYCARYVMKKVPVRGLDYEKHYAGRVPEFIRMSLRPGIGALWYERYRTDVYPTGDIVGHSGSRQRVPRYYDKLYSKSFPLEFEDLQFRRAQRADAFLDDTSPDRLLVRETVAKAALTFKRKSI